MCCHSGFPIQTLQDTLPCSEGTIPLLVLPSNWIIYFFSCCVRSRVKGEHFPLPPNSLNHSQCSTKNLESPYGSEHPVTAFYCPERGESGTGTWAGQLLPTAAPGPRVSRDGAEVAARHQMQLPTLTGSSLGGKSQPLHHMGF